MGYQPPGFPSQLHNLNIPSLQERMERVIEWRKDALDAHNIAMERMKERINVPLPRFLEGQKVWLDTRNFRTTYNKKIHPKREGPFKIKNVLGPVSYQLDLPKTWHIHDVFHPIHLSPYKETDQFGPTFIPSPPTIEDGEQWYEVDHIVNHKRQGQGYRYLIRWKNYGPEEDTWEPASNLKNAKETLMEYKRRHKLL